MKNKTFIYIGVVFLCLMLLCVSMLITNATSPSSKKTASQNKKEIDCPHISLKGNDVEKANSEIKNLCELASKKEDNFFQYQISDKEDTYSIVLVYGYYEDDAVYTTYEIKTYNFSKNTGVLLSDEELFKKYNIDTNKANMKISETLKYYYQDEVNQGYLNENECDYDCFLKLRNLYNRNYYEDVRYYVGDGKLFAFLPFVLDSYMADEDYYGRPMDAFRILISY